MAKADGRIAGALLPSERRNLLRLIAQSPTNQAGLAARLHSNEGYISNLVKGKAGATLARWREICGLLGKPLTALFDPTPPPSPPATPMSLAQEIEERSRQLRELLAQPTPPDQGLPIRAMEAKQEDTERRNHAAAPQDRPPKRKGSGAAKPPRRVRS